MSNLEALIQAAQYLEENDRELLCVYRYIHVRMHVCVHALVGVHLCAVQKL